MCLTQWSGELPHREAIAPRSYMLDLILRSTIDLGALLAIRLEGLKKPALGGLCDGC